MQCMCSRVRVGRQVADQVGPEVHPQHESLLPQEPRSGELTTLGIRMQPVLEHMFAGLHC